MGKFYATAVHIFQIFIQIFPAHANVIVDADKKHRRRVDARQFEGENGTEFGNWALHKGQFRVALKNQAFVVFSAIIRIIVDL